MSTTIIRDKNGRQRKRSTYVVYIDTADRFSQVAKLSGVPAAELLNAAMEQTIAAWEREHGKLPTITGNMSATIDLTAAVSTAAAAPNLKRGNPHPSGRKPKAK